MAQVVSALGFNVSSIQSVEIDWKIIRIDGSGELAPVLRMASKDGNVKEISQVDTKSY